jgi:hypothetical protein
MSHEEILEISKGKEYRDLPERQQREILFELNARLLYHKEFLPEILALIGKYPPPFEESGYDEKAQHNRILKPEFT